MRFVVSVRFCVFFVSVGEGEEEGRVEATEESQEKRNYGEAR